MMRGTAADGGVNSSKPMKGGLHDETSEGGAGAGCGSGGGAMGTRCGAANGGAEGGTGAGAGGDRASCAFRLVPLLVVSADSVVLLSFLDSTFFDSAFFFGSFFLEFC